MGNRICAPNAWIKCGKVSADEHMRGGIFYEMKPSKQVQFLEKVSKSYLGLDGLQLVVNADKGTRGDANEFASLGKKMLQKIDGEYIFKKYGKLDGLEIKQKLYEERIKWIRRITDTIN